MNDRRSPASAIRSLKVVAEDLGSRLAALNVPFYNGGLFLTTPDAGDDTPEATAARFLATHKVADRDLARALDLMSRTVDEKRRGPFPIGVAVETTVPVSWYDAKAAPATVRVAAIGHGGFFTGLDLSPTKETLMLNTINWLLGRDEYLPKADVQWSYPRVVLNARDQALWAWVIPAALPLVFSYIGLTVLLARRIR